MYNISYAAGDAATEGHFKIVGSLEADSKQLYWDSSKGFLVVPKVVLQSITKPTRAFLRSIVLKD